MIELSSIDSLARHLGGLRRGLIGIDGCVGVGKSMVAGELATRLGLRCVHLDDFLVRHQGAFLKYLQYDELARELRAAPAVKEMA